MGLTKREHDGMLPLVTAVMVGLALPLAAQTLPLPPVPPPPTEHLPELPAGYRQRYTWTGSPALPSGWTVGGAGTRQVSLAIDATAPASPPDVARITYPAGFRSGEQPVLLEFNNIGSYSSLFFTYWFRYSPNFVGDPSSVNKHLFVFGCEAHVVLYTALRFSGSAASGTVDAIAQRAVSSPSDVWLAGRGGRAVSVSKTAWTRVSVELTPTRIRMWVNGTPSTDVAVRYANKPCNPKISPTWGGNSGVSVPASQYLDIDEVRFYAK